jgi:hypothetical protein
VELDEPLADAHIAMAYLDWDYDFDRSCAHKEFNRGIELAPRNGVVFYNSDVLSNCCRGLDHSGTCGAGNRGVPTRVRACAALFSCQ